MIQHIFANKPFYKWFRRCSECGKRSIWNPMMKCRSCKTYNHRSRKVDHVECVESAKRGNAVDALEHAPQTLSRISLWLKEIDEIASSSGSSHDDEFEIMGPDQLHPLSFTEGETQKSSADVQKANAQNPGSVIRTVKEYSATTRADDKYVNHDEYDLLQKNTRSTEKPANSCCWTNAQYPKTFWPNHRHFLHSANCPVVPFPGPSVNVVSDAGGDQQQIRIEDAVEQKISTGTTTSITVTPMNNNHHGEP